MKDKAMDEKIRLLIDANHKLCERAELDRAEITMLREHINSLVGQLAQCHQDADYSGSLDSRVWH